MAHRPQWTRSRTKRRPRTSKPRSRTDDGPLSDPDASTPIPTRPRRMASVDLSVAFPSRGVIRLQSRTLFGEVENPTCREFLGCVFEAAEITGVTIRGGRPPHADLRFCPRVSRVERVVERVVALLRRQTDRPGHPP